MIHTDRDTVEHGPPGTCHAEPDSTIPPTVSLKATYSNFAFERVQEVAKANRVEFSREGLRLCALSATRGLIIIFSLKGCFPTFTS